MKENEWRPVVGYEGRYEVSNDGRIKSLAQEIRRKDGRVWCRPDTVLSGHLTHTGYMTVRLMGADGRSRVRQIHILVLEAFVGPQPDGLRAVHRDRVKTNNAIDNLYWGDRFQEIRECILQNFGRETLETIAAMAGTTLHTIEVQVDKLRRARRLPSGRSVYVPSCNFAGCGSAPTAWGLCETHAGEYESRRAVAHAPILPGTEWRPVAEFPQYEVHYTGDVRNRNGRALSPYVKNSGHYCVNLRGKTRYNHRLVLEAFVGPCPEGRIGCHKDDDPSNNHVDNLYWGTYADNQLDRVRNGIHTFAKRTACSQGHEYVDGSFVVYNGARHCLECRAAYSPPAKLFTVDNLSESA